MREAQRHNMSSLRHIREESTTPSRPMEDHADHETNSDGERHPRV